MAVRNVRNAVMLFKIQAAEGTAETPSAATDAIAVELPADYIAPEPNLIQTNEATGSLDGLGSIVGGIRYPLNFSMLMKGSGAAGTPPEWGKVLKCCSWAEVVTAAAVPVAAEAATAGDETTVTGGTGFAATAQLYRGMPLLLSGNPAAGAVTFVTDYTAGKVFTLADSYDTPLDINTDLQIPANVLYRPVSSAIPCATVWLYVDGIVWKLQDWRGTMSLAIEAGGIGRFTFNGTGLFTAHADAAVPAATLVSTRPPVWKDPTGQGSMLLDRERVALRTFSLSNGNALAYPENPNAAEGFDGGQITGRNLTGSVDPLEGLVATSNRFADFRTGTKKTMNVRLGATAGNRFGVTIPSALHAGYRPGNRNGLAIEQIEFEATGQDAGAFICSY